MIWEQHIVADLNDLDTVSSGNKGAPLKVKHPTTGKILRNPPKEGDGEGEAWTILLYGSDSKVYRKEFKEGMRKQTDLRKDAGEIDMDINEEMSVEMLAKLTIGWSGIMKNGQPVPFSKEAAVEIYMQYRWLREQVDAFIHNRGNYLKD